MQVINKGNDYKVRLAPGKAYDVVSENSAGWLGIIDELGEESFFPPDDFEAESGT